MNTKVRAGAMAMTGRPRIDKEARMVPLTFRVTPSELVRLMAAAERQGSNMTDTIRRLVFARLAVEEASLSKARLAQIKAG